MIFNSLIYVGVDRKQNSNNNNKQKTYAMSCQKYRQKKNEVKAEGSYKMEVSHMQKLSTYIH